MKNTKITTNCLTTTDKKKKKKTSHQKKIFDILKQRSHNKMTGVVVYQHNEIPFLLGEWPTKLNIIILQRFFHKSESSEPHTRLPSLVVLETERGDPANLTLKAGGVWSQNSTGLGEIETPLLEGTHKILNAPGHRRKSNDIIERLGKPHLLVLEGLLPGGGQGDVLANTKDPQQTKQLWERKMELE